MRKTMKEALKNLAGKVDINDVFAFGGLALVCYGVAQINVPAAWIIGGAVFMYVGLRG